ncbi:MAG: ABC transporter ATP-binding protein/permease [Candidatus Cloacimonetes bacterium]|nr:ABC transporter ATP-binding protein/permease [Candidatus Cloacimonadota bacterium]
MKTEMSLKDGLKKLFPMIISEKQLFLGGLLFMVLTTVGRLFDPIVIAHIIDVSVPKQDIKDMFLWGFVFAGVILVSGFMSYLQIMWMAKLGVKIITKLKFKLFNHLMFLPVSWFDKTPVGELISRVESDCERVKDLFSQFSVTMIGNILFFVGMLVILLYKDWKITLFLFIPMTCVLCLSIIIIRYLTKYYKKSRELNAVITGRLTEYIQGISIVQLFNQQKRVIDYIDEKSKEKQQIDTKASFIEYGAWGVNDFLIQTVFIIIIVLLLSPKILNESVTIGTLIIFIQYSVRLVWPIIQISENLNQFQRAFVSLRRVFGLLEEKTEDLFETQAEMKVPTFNEEIEFSNVWFKYKSSDDKSKEEWVLKDVSFKIRKGSRVALVGASGSGKTTTVSLLCRFYDIQKGQILVDGVDINSFKLSDWRRKIGLVLQDIILFPGNLLENIRIYNDDISEKNVLDSIDTVHANQLFERMDKNLYSEIRERGQNLSMGERQLLSFARAVSFNPEIVIMDEATASIDAKTESLIQKSMSKLLSDKTALIVAHRLASVIDCDEILLFDNGQIIARGSHNQLLQSSSEYKKLVELQFLKNTESNTGV